MSPRVTVTVVETSSKSWRERLLSGAGAIVLPIAIPAAILLLGIPVVLAVRGFIEAFNWLAIRVFQ